MQDLFGQEEWVDNFEDYDSKEEYYFYRWIEEAVEMGWIHEFIWQPESFQIFNSIDFKFERMLKTKSVEKTRELLRPQSYRPDFYIIWNPIAEGKLHFPIDGCPPEEYLTSYFKSQKMKTSDMYFSYGDVKGTHNMHGGDRIMSMIQKLIWGEYGMYINKTVVSNQKDANNVFHRTWTPERYMITDKIEVGKPKKMRKIHHSVRNKHEFKRSHG